MEAHPVADEIVLGRIDAMKASLMSVPKLPEEHMIDLVSRFFCLNGFSVSDELDGVDMSDLSHDDLCNGWTPAHKGFANRVSQFKCRVLWLL